jgi:lipopolysaccharide/colanic/teichoic acid biosynthesis glycosyltransferase
VAPAALRGRLAVAKHAVEAGIGRDPDALRATFPGCDAVGYQDIPIVAQGCELLLHLAVLNNNEDAPCEAFERVNVELTLETYRAASAARINQFVFVSSTHALDERNTSFYAETKREAVRKLKALNGIEVRTLYIPAVVGDKLSGKLAILNNLPMPLRGFSTAVLTALRPTVHADRITDTLLSYIADGPAVEKSLLLTDGQENNPAFSALKRLQDLAFALSILILLWWAMAIIWLTIRLQSPGPGLFRQQRVGRNGRIFTCYKFRTMYVSTLDAGTHETSASAVTRLGGFLRRMKLDELPQVINILMNQMSLVGPQPCLPSQAELIAERRSRGVLLAKPGITGLAQVNGIDMSNPVVLANWDQRYLKFQSIILDLKIIIQTAIGKGTGDNVR